MLRKRIKELEEKVSKMSDCLQEVCEHQWEFKHLSPRYYRSHCLNFVCARCGLSRTVALCSLTKEQADGALLLGAISKEEFSLWNESQKVKDIDKTTESGQDR